jgi:hypothetical protein
MKSHDGAAASAQKSKTVARGSRSCLRTANIHAPCAVCGEYTSPVHVPLRRSGFFCAIHCVECTTHKQIREGEKA